ncbi:MULTISPECIES: NAD(P)H-quinone oxidoreductase [Burkholderia]|uniref:NAD(P)H-quinone oxidoreductase n=1 Tax=Burkholderia TaxID=32008 RepID=UPI000841ACF2|nr:MULTISPECIES: NAD(P)H-quinone oxidoreductase [unclassified Burkholderia]AOK29723.1 quinone oxidoreductase [Burkholderia sp. Bp7605]
MKAITFDTFGKADVLRLTEVEDPVIRPADLLVRVYAAGVNRADLLLRLGKYGRPFFGDSPVMGLEISGEVIETGRDTVGYRAGDRVMGIVGGGAYAELARIDYRMAMPIPYGLDYAHAAAIPEVFVTAHEALFHLGRLQYGDRALIHAASSGIGCAAVQLAKAKGATVYATAKIEKHVALHKLGADILIDPRTEDYEDVLASTTAGQGVDVILDLIGAGYLERNVRSLAYGGRLVQVGLLGGAVSTGFPLDRLLYRHLQIFGTVMKSRDPEAKHAMVRRFRENWEEHFVRRTLLPVIDSRFPLACATQAHQRMEHGRGLGKVILIVRP